MKVIGSWTFTQRHTMGRPGATDCGMAYLLGLQRLGHEVFLFEEVEPDRVWGPNYEKVMFDGWHGRRHFEAVARDYGLWPRCCLIYNQGEATHGMTMADAVRVAKECDLLLDVGCFLRTPEIIGNARRRAYVDETPAKTQAFVSEYGIDQGFAVHDWFFTVGLNVGTARGDVPDCGLSWHGIVHPVVLDQWPARVDPSCRSFTTISNWASKETFNLNGRYSGEKSDQWLRFLALPRRTSQPIEVALNVAPGYDGDLRQFTENGWIVTDPRRMRTLDDYREYIAASRGEFSIGNNRYVQFRTGWTSDRSARYLASGKPVLVQSTGFEDVLPTGEGLVSFHTLEDAVVALEGINRDYLRHCRAARAIAEEHFDATKVLGRMLEVMELPVRARA